MQYFITIMLYRAIITKQISNNQEIPKEWLPPVLWKRLQKLKQSTTPQICLVFSFNSGLRWSQWYYPDKWKAYEPYVLSSLWSSDALWRQWSRSTLVLVMAWCRTAPSHYLNQCWLISKFQLHTSDGNFTKIYISHQWLRLTWKLLI